MLGEFTFAKVIIIREKFIPTKRETFSKFEKLIISDLSGSTFILPKLVPGFFADLSNLRVLQLSDTNIAAISQYAFSGLESLKLLNLSGCRLIHLRPYTFPALHRV